MSRIFIVDDRRTNRRILGELARQVEESVEVSDYEDPRDALLAASDSVPDLIITDFNMPEMDGATFVDNFRALPGCADIPVIVVTAYEDREYRYRALEAGATDFLLSPVDHHEFITRARNLLNLRRQIIAREAAETANEAKTAFLANMSHELRTPLNAIIGFAEVMQNETLGPIGTPKYLEYSAHISESAEQLRAIIQNILDITLIEEGKLALNLEEINAGKALQAATFMLALDASQKDIVLNADLPTDLPPIEVDKGKFSQIFLNLIANAIKFTPEGGNVTVSAEQVADGLNIKVADTGIGMSRDDQNLAIQRFGQVSNNPHNKKYAGAGLGLTLAINLIELHGGSLSIDSAEGKGTSVQVFFPLVVMRQTA
jgi:two-component system cell cycle sensor histidine kinase PleC